MKNNTMKENKLIFFRNPRPMAAMDESGLPRRLNESESDPKKERRDAQRLAKRRKALLKPKEGKSPAEKKEIKKLEGKLGISRPKPERTRKGQEKLRKRFAQIQRDLINIEASPHVTKKIKGVLKDVVQGIEPKEGYGILGYRVARAEKMLGKILEQVARREKEEEKQTIPAAESLAYLLDDKLDEKGKAKHEADMDAFFNTPDNKQTASQIAKEKAETREFYKDLGITPKATGESIAENKDGKSRGVEKIYKEESPAQQLKSMIGTFEQSLVKFDKRLAELNSAAKKIRDSIKGSTVKSPELNAVEAEIVSITKEIAETRGKFDFLSKKLKTSITEDFAMTESETLTGVMVALTDSLAEAEHNIYAASSATNEAIEKYNAGQGAALLKRQEEEEVEEEPKPEVAEFKEEEKEEPEPAELPDELKVLIGKKGEFVMPDAEWGKEGTEAIVTAQKAVSETPKPVPINVEEEFRTGLDRVSREGRRIRHTLNNVELLYEIVNADTEDKKENMLFGLVKKKIITLPKDIKINSENFDKIYENAITDLLSQVDVNSTDEHKDEGVNEQAKNVLYELITHAEEEVGLEKSEKANSGDVKLRISRLKEATYLRSKTLFKNESDYETALASFEQKRELGVSLKVETGNLDFREKIAEEIGLPLEELSEKAIIRNGFTRWRDFSLKFMIPTFGEDLLKEQEDKKGALSYLATFQNTLDVIDKSKLSDKIKESTKDNLIAAAKGDFTRPDLSLDGSYMIAIIKFMEATIKNGREISLLRKNGVINEKQFLALSKAAAEGKLEVAYDIAEYKKVHAVALQLAKASNKKPEDFYKDNSYSLFSQLNKLRSSQVQEKFKVETLARIKGGLEDLLEDGYLSKEKYEKHIKNANTDDISKLEGILKAHMEAANKYLSEPNILVDAVFMGIENVTTMTLPEYYAAKKTWEVKNKKKAVMAEVADYKRTPHENVKKELPDVSNPIQKIGKSESLPIDGYKTQGGLGYARKGIERKDTEDTFSRADFEAAIAKLEKADKEASVTQLDEEVADLSPETDWLDELMLDENEEPSKEQVAVEQKPEIQDRIKEIIDAAVASGKKDGITHDKIRENIQSELKKEYYTRAKGVIDKVFASAKSDNDKSDKIHETLVKEGIINDSDFLAVGANTKEDLLNSAKSLIDGRFSESLADGSGLQSEVVQAPAGNEDMTFTTEDTKPYDPEMEKAHAGEPEPVEGLAVAPEKADVQAGAPKPADKLAKDERKDNLKGDV